MRSSKSIVGFSVLVGLTLLSAPASAIQYLGSTQFTCTDFTAAGTGPAVLDRDNTGTGAETVRIDVRDGAGVLLYTLTFTNTLGTYAAGLINTTAYTSPPTANPISMTLTSVAGNGLPEVVTFAGSGVCLQLGTTIPTLGISGLLALAGLLAVSAFWLLARR